MPGIDDAGQRGLLDPPLPQGDEESGVSFETLDEDAHYGTEACRALIEDLHEAGLNVCASNAGVPQGVREARAGRSSKRTAR